MIENRTARDRMSQEKLPRKLKWLFLLVKKTRVRLREKVGDIYIFDANMVLIVGAFGIPNMLKEVYFFKK